MRRPGLCGLLLAVVVLSALECSANYREGDLIPMARRAQFHGLHRTQWHDVMGHYCPKYGVDRLVALPLPQPIGYMVADEYKLQFSFDGDRFITPWLLVIGKRAASPPYVEVTLTRSGEAVRAVRAEVFQMDWQDVKEHRTVVAEFVNATHWPKGLLVHYRWASRREVDGDRGLLLLFAAAVAAVAVLGLSAARSHREKLARFLADVGGDEGLVAGMGAKAD